MRKIAFKKPRKLIIKITPKWPFVMAPEDQVAPGGPALFSDLPASVDADRPRVSARADNGYTLVDQLLDET
jgi:hypothetical protein